MRTELCITLCITTANGIIVAIAIYVIQCDDVLGRCVRQYFDLKVVRPTIYTMSGTNHSITTLLTDYATKVVINADNKRRMCLPVTHLAAVTD